MNNFRASHEALSYIHVIIIRVMSNLVQDAVELFKEVESLRRKPGEVLRKIEEVSKVPKALTGATGDNRKTVIDGQTLDNLNDKQVDELLAERLKQEGLYG